MSEMERKKAKLVKVLDGYHSPVNIQLWLESEWSVYVEEELSQEVAFGVMESHFEEEDWEFDYYLFDDELYMVETWEDIDFYNDYMVAEQTYEGIDVDCIWYNGGASFSECVTEALKKLEGEVL